VADSALLILGGDIHANCKIGNRSAATAPLVAKYPGAVVVVLGDNAGADGTASEFACYDRTWGQFKSRTFATIGNHELRQDTAGTAYYDYFNGVGVDSGRAGHRGRGNYTLDLAGWRIYVANNFRNGDDQQAWMAQDLVATPRKCTMAIWHSPVFTSNAEVVPATSLRRWWKVLYSGGADVVVGAHAHNYERFAEVTPFGVVDQQRGIREFVVGTGGGASLFGFVSQPHPASRKRIVTWGILKLTLWPTRYKWQFIDLTGAVLDSGSDACH
jgi:alkaline phosphatase